uniref:Ribosomal protein L15 (RP-L18e, RPL18) n=1 Tax=uncultured marine thaumarchaeote KM3_06_B06 TaxID=1455974 RepID=A0A075G3H6_9ARCH|nr:ribosomal protein L15 (RP-L18e, RPL18) [uncultured marine thaumarchaeote KM3_06_B06]
MVNQIVLHMIKDLKQASKKNEAPIWSRLAELAIKPSSSRRVVNLTRINKTTKDNDVLFVPGKVLGTGNISHKIILSSFSISTTAAQKIIQTGGKIMTYSDMIKKYPTGKGVMIFG